MSVSRILSTLALAATLAAAHAAEPESVKLAELVARATPGVNAPKQRIVLVPKAIRFQAELVDGPKPQRADYLQQALQLMRVNPPPKVSERIVLGYRDAQGQQRTLPAYIEQGAARSAQALKVGEQREFTALHVYNYSRGPALLVMGFGAAQ